MKRKMKHIISYIMVLTLLIVLSPAVLNAALSDSQIEYTGGTVYYDAAGQKVDATALGEKNAVVSLTKTAKGTDTANEFIIDLKVGTLNTSEDVQVSQDAAVVLVLDISASMSGTNSTGTSHMATLKSAVKSFLDSYVAEAGNSVRSVSLVTFWGTAKIQSGWVDANDRATLSSLKNQIDALTTGSATFTQGGLVFARNLLRTEALPKGKDNAPIANRSVILFTDGGANQYHTFSAFSDNFVSYSAGSTLTHNAGAGNEFDQVSADEAENMANDVKKSSFTQNGTTYQKHDAKLFTIGFGNESPTEWLKNKIATSTSHAYTATNIDQLNETFAKINQTINKVTTSPQARVVTDPMGKNIKFLGAIPPDHMDKGILEFSSANNTLKWNLEKETSVATSQNIKTYSCSYRISLDITASDFDFDTAYDTNKPTILNYVMATDDVPGAVLEANFPIPKVRGTAPETPETPKQNKKPQVGKWVKNPEVVIVPLMPKSGS